MTLPTTHGCSSHPPTLSQLLAQQPLTEILSNQTLAGLTDLWNTNPPRFTRGINPWRSAQGVSWGGAHPQLLLTLLEPLRNLWLNLPPLQSETHTHSRAKTRGTCPKLPKESKLVTIPVK